MPHSDHRIEPRPLYVDGLLERGDEHAALRRAVGHVARQHGGRAIGIVGSAGTGKTALLRVAESLCQRESLRVFAARGAVLERDFAFGVVRQLFERSVVGANTEERLRLFADAARLAERVVSRNASDAATLPESEYEVLHALYWFVVHATDGGPLALVVDDLHWADRESLRFLGYVAHRARDLPLLVIVASRPPIGELADPVLSELLADEALQPLTLRSLSVTAIARVVRERVGTASDDFCRACHAVTRGNPLFVQQLLLAIESDERAPALDVELVERLGGRALTELIQHRLLRVDDADHGVVRAVAVLGGRAEAAVVAELAGCSQDDVAASVDRLSKAGLFEHSMQPEFAHPVVRAAIYENVPPAERAAAHATAANALLARGASDEEVASHILAAGRTTDRRWVEPLLRAASAARRRGGLETAAVYLRRALDHELPIEQRTKLLRILGLCEAYNQDFLQAKQHLLEAERSAVVVRDRATCALSLGRLLNVEGDPHAAVDAFARGAAALGPSDDDLRVALETELLGSTRLSSTLVDTWRTRLRRLEAAERRTPAAPVLSAHRAIRAAFESGTRAEATALAQRAIESGQLSPSRATFYVAIYTLILCEEYQAAHHHLSDALKVASAQGLRVTKPVVYCYRALTAWLAGSVERAHADVLEGLAIAGTENFAGMRLHALRVRCLMEAGESRTAHEMLVEAGLDGAIPDVAFSPDLLAARGTLQMVLGDVSKATQDLEVAAERESRWGPRGLLLHDWAPPLALAYVHLGRHDEARDLVQRQVAVAREFDAPRAVASALRARAIVMQRDPDVIAALTEAAVAAGRSGAMLERAITEEALGASLVASGQRSSGREHLRQALILSTEAGASATAERIKGKLMAGGGRPPRLHTTGVEALTPQERRIAELAAAELTNRQIGQELYVTEKTVESHLSRAYKKLGISSRWQLRQRLDAPPSSA